MTVKWVIWLGIVIIIIGLLVLSMQGNDKQTINQRSERSSSRHFSGILKIPAGSGIYDTGIKCRKGDRGWFKSESEMTVLLWDDERKRKIKISHRGQSFPCTKSGELQFIKQHLPTQASYKVSSSS